MRLSSSRLKVFSCIPRCVPVQTSAMRRGELRRLGILPCNQTFQDLFCGCGRCGFLCCECDASWLKKICQDVAWIRIPGRVLVHGNALSCFCSNTPTNAPVDNLDSNLCRVRFRWSTHSPKLGNSTPFNAGGLCDCRAAHRCGRVEMAGTMLDQPSQQRTSRLQHDSRLLF